MAASSVTVTEIQANAVQRASGPDFIDYFYGFVNPSGTLSRTTGGFTVVKGGAGVYNYTFDEVQPDTNYGVMACIADTITGTLRVQNIANNTFTILTFDNSFVGRDTAHNVDVKRITGAS